MDKTMVKYLILSLLLIVCEKVHGQNLQFTELDSLQVETLSSLEKITDDLYIMDYKAEYYFSEYMTRGMGNLSVTEFFEKSLDTIPSSNFRLCTAFMARNDKDILIGRNFDWEDIPGLILFTAPDNGYKSISLVPIDLMLNINARIILDNKKLLWAPYFPVDGMNDRGLVVIELAVEGEEVYDENKITMVSLHLIRLLLDYASNLDEALVLLDNYNNVTSHRCHFFIADSSGNSAIVEYLDNKIVVTRNRKLWQAVTNTMVYKKSEKQLRKACLRYKVVSQYLSSNNGLLSTTETINLLKKVSAKGSYTSMFDIYSSTQWSVVYNLGQSSVDIVSRMNFGTVYHYELNK